MTHRPVAVLALLLTLIAPHAIARGVDNASPPAPTSGAAVDAQHQQLAELVGLWTVRQSLWLHPGAPQIDLGTAMFNMVLGGRQLQQDLRVSSRVPFQALGYIGYDPTTRMYVATWTDLNLDEVMVLRGDYDARDRTYRLGGDMSDGAGHRIPTREELQRVDDDHFVVRYYETRQVKEALVVELAYSRR
ncbi:DUF1579 family protein [Lysobacter sp. HA18]